MASSLPPVKGAAFSFETALVSQADTDIFKAGPTLAAGDVKVIKDGTYDDNIDTLPSAVTSCTNVITVALSATEMNADRVTVILHDASGDEWQDQVITIFTTGQTLDTTDGIADDIKATVNHADYGNAKLVRSTTPANTLTVDASHQALALTNAVTNDAITAAAIANGAIDAATFAAGAITATVIATNAIDADALAADGLAEIADAVWNEAIADHAVAGSTGAALSAAGAAGDPWITALPGAYAAGSAGDIIGNLVTDIGALTPAVAISATTAASVSTGALAVRTYHSLSQAISSTYAGNLNAATKLWLAVKAEKDDTDAQSVIFIEKTAGLTVLAGAAYTTVAHGSLTVGGLAGAWTVTVALDEVATGLLTAYADGMLWAECKALVAGTTVAVWDGVCDVSRGIVNAVA